MFIKECQKTHEKVLNTTVMSLQEIPENPLTE
jgi:hypothetical protein